MQKPLEITYNMLAERNSRIVNLIIDFIVTTILNVGLAAGCNWLYDYTGIDGFQIGPAAMANIRYTLMGLCVHIVYYGLFETLSMRTLGKYVTNTMVVNRDGSRPDTNRILIRTLCRQIPFEIISFLGVYPIGWHDTFSKTLVVDAAKLKKAQELNAKKQMSDNL